VPPSDWRRERQVRSRVVIRFALFLLCLAGLAAASVSFPEVRTRAELYPNGSARLVQELTCRFEGKRRNLCLNYPVRGRNVEVNRITERSDQRSGPVEGLRTRTDEREGLLMEWEVNARDETRYYVLDLTVPDIVRRYQDLAHVRLAIIGRAPGPIGRATLELRLPAAADTFRLFADGGDSGYVGPDRTTGFLAERDISSGERWIAHVVTDAAVFGEVPQREGEMEQSEHTLLYRDPVAAYYDDRPSPRWYLVPVTLLVPLVLFLLLYIAHGREPHVGYEARYERAPPDSIPPLAVPPIMRQRPDVTELPTETADAAFATLLYAANKGVLDILPGEAGSGAGRGFALAHPERLDSLDELSRNVVEYFFHDASQGRDSVTAEDIRRHVREQPDGLRFWLRLMSQEGRAWWWRRLNADFLEADSLRAYRLLGFGAPVLTGLTWFLLPFGLTTFSFFLTLPALMLLFVLSCVLSVAIYARVGRAILRWTVPVYREHLRWQAFRRFLVDFSAIEQAPIELAAIWREYYVYAVAFGIGEKFMRGLSRLEPCASLGSELLGPQESEGWGIGWEVPRPRLHTRAALGQGIHQMLESFRSGAAFQAKRPNRLEPFLFWRVGKQ